MSSSFELKKASNGEYQFNLKSQSGQTLVMSETYKAKESALNGIESVRKNSQRETAFESKAAANGKYHFVIKASNGQVVGQSTLYADEAACKAAIAAVMGNAYEATFTDKS